MENNEKYPGIDKYATTDEWRGNYIRAEWAGRVLQETVFKKITAALKLGENSEEGKKAFYEACYSVMQDIPSERERLVADMWAATWASRRRDQVKSCW